MARDEDLAAGLHLPFEHALDRLARESPTAAEALGLALVASHAERAGRCGPLDARLRELGAAAGPEGGAAIDAAFRVSSD